MYPLFFLFVLVCIIMALIICLYQDVHYVLMQRYIFNIVWRYTYSIRLFLLKQNKDTKVHRYKGKYTKCKKYIHAFSFRVAHQALAGSTPRLSTRGTSVLPQQITKQLYFGCYKKVRLFKQKRICWILCRKFSDAVMPIFSVQSVISRV